MTEAEWLIGTDIIPMLEFLQGKASDRKLRLFAVACCRRIWHLLTDHRSRNAVDMAERDADGMTSHQEVANAALDAFDASIEDRAYEATGLASSEWAACETLGYLDANGVVSPHRPSFWVVNAAFNAASAKANAANAEHPNLDLWEKTFLAERREQLHLLLDIFGNPFRPVTIPPAVLAWNAGTIWKLAQTIYDDRAFDRLPVLADALEEAGCSNAEILTHCRQQAEHVRGCWVVAQMLGKE